MKIVKKIIWGRLKGLEKAEIWYVSTKWIWTTFVDFSNSFSCSEYTWNLAQIRIFHFFNFLLSQQLLTQFITVENYCIKSQLSEARSSDLIWVFCQITSSHLKAFFEKKKFSQHLLTFVDSRKNCKIVKRFNF